MTIRSFDGYGNNLNNPEWGRAGTRLFRHPGLAAYVADGHTPSGQDRPNARDISNLVCNQTGNGTKNEEGLTDFLWAWGQFMDHELDLTDAAEPAEPLPIRVKPGDQLPDGGMIPVRRSRFDPSTGGDAQNPREQINLLSSYIDGSNIYGETVERASVLRSHIDGKLKSSGSGLLPKNTCSLLNDHGPPRQLDPADFFVAGDIRCNEHIVLTCMHTLWMREHNRTCDELIGVLSSDNDDGLYQEARRRVIAELQAINFEEFLPALLGPDAIPPYLGYQPTVNTSISNIFSTACYRLGHSMVSPVIQRIPPAGTPTIEPLKLEDAFWSPQLMDNAPGIFDEILNGLSQQAMQRVDTRTVDALRNLLFHDQLTDEDALLDLAALNIQRGRDHGLPTYNECRSALGLARKADIRDITQDEETQARLMMAYRNHVDLIDPWVGGMAEDHVMGAQVGELFFHVIREQFTRLRDGDRFWYEAPDAGFSEAQVAEFKATRLSHVIRRNSENKQIQEDVFRLPSNMAN